MKLFLSSLFLAVALSEASPAPFQNLGFDDAVTNSVVQLIPGDPFFVVGPSSELLPGWEVSFSGATVPSLFFDSFPPGYGWAAVFSSSFDFPVYGDYGLALAPSFTWTFPPVPRSITLSQRGDVPADAQWIRFVNWGGPVELRIDGQLIPYTVDLQEIWPRTLHTVRFVSADVSAFAGQNVELSFTATWAETVPPEHGLDRILFVIPEPPPWLLLGLGGLLLIASPLIRFGRLRARAEPRLTDALSRRLLALFLATLVDLPAHAASFINLGFDNALTNHVRIAAADVLPRATVSDLLAGWIILKARAEEENVCFNSAPLGLGYVTVVPKEGQFAGGDFYPVDGAYALIVAPTGPHWGQANPITLTQRGQVPAGAKTISFLNFGAPFEVRINGQLIPLKYEELDPGRGYPEQVLRRATGEVSAFAGQEVELSFIARYQATAPFIHGLDRIEFGPAATSE